MAVKRRIPRNATKQQILRILSVPRYPTPPILVTVDKAKPVAERITDEKRGFWRMA